MEVDATPLSPDGSVSIEISPDVTPSEDKVTNLDVAWIERKVDLVAAEETKMNPQKWVVKKRESQISELDQLKLKAVVLHDSIGSEIDMTQPVGFSTVDLEKLIWLLELGGAYLDELWMV